MVVTERVCASIAGGNKAEEMGMKGRPWLFWEVSLCVMVINKSVVRNISFSV